LTKYYVDYLKRFNTVNHSYIWIFNQ
jgi:hypothetical protein